MNRLKRIFCRHTDLVHVRNIYGDEVNAAGGMRSWWKCAKCGKAILRPFLKGEHSNPCPKCGRTEIHMLCE